MKYVCNVCGYVYDEDLGAPQSNIPAGTNFDDIPEDYRCPVCRVGKNSFRPQ